VWSSERACNLPPISPRRYSALESHAAASLVGLETRTEPGDAGAVDDPFEKRQVHTAHELGVLAGEGMEGAVVEHDIAALRSRLVAMVDKDVDDLRPRPTRVRPNGAPAFLGDLAKVAAGAHSPDQQLPGQLVAPRRNAHLDARVGRSIELGRSAGARPAPTSRAAVLEDEEPVGNQTVEVELGSVEGDADGRRRLLAADRCRRRGDEPIQRPPYGITEGGRSIELGVKV